MAPRLLTGRHPDTARNAVTDILPVTLRTERTQYEVLDLAIIGYQAYCSCTKAAVKTKRAHTCRTAPAIG